MYSWQEAWNFSEEEAKEAVMRFLIENHGKPVLLLNRRTQEGVVHYIVTLETPASYIEMKIEV